MLSQWVSENLQWGLLFNFNALVLSGQVIKFLSRIVICIMLALIKYTFYKNYQSLSLVFSNLYFSNEDIHMK